MKTFKAYLLSQELTLTILGDQTISVHSAEPTEEGWSSTTTTYQYNQYEKVIRRTITDDGRDCDGRLTFTTVFVCKDDELEACDGRPNWRPVKSEQYDEFAQMEGY